MKADISQTLNYSSLSGTKAVFGACIGSSILGGLCVEAADNNGTGPNKPNVMTGTRVKAKFI